tara:strand:- start:1397 stop:1741 length:345 start_codon:yes stop_codon:yes gene_type:complete
MFKYFLIDEFRCQQTGENNIDIAFVTLLDDLRGRCGFPFVITSGYRSPFHTIEASKNIPGYHTKGIAADIAMNNSSQRFILVDWAMSLGFSGIGIGPSFVHLDTREDKLMWVYS